MISLWPILLPSQKNARSLPLHRPAPHAMAGAMKPAATALALILLGALPASASLLPEDWMSTQIPNAGGTNQWFFFPGPAKEPRIVAKVIANAASVNRVTLSADGPPVWTASPSQSTAGLNKEGFFAVDPDPTRPDRGFLVGTHLPTGGTSKLRMWSFANGGVGDEVVDNVAAPNGFDGVSAAVDPAGNVHAAWIWSPGSNESLVYGRRNSSGVWEIAEVVLNRTNNVDNGYRIGATAVVPSAFGAANVYFTLTTSGSITSLMRASSIINGGSLFLGNLSSPPLVTSGVKPGTLRGIRMASADRVFYFEGTALRRWNGAGATDVETNLGANFNPRSIHVAVSPIDGRQRVAWYDANANSKKIHYLKPNSADLAYTAYTPVTVTGGGADTDLYGLHFDATGFPYILYRKLVAEGYVAFPNDEFDPNGNGRAEIIDEALNSPQNPLEVLPVKAAVAGVTNSADRFKIRFTTIGSAAPVAALPKLETTSTTANLRYEVEVSTNGTTWTKLTANSSIAFTKTAESGSSPNLIRTYVGVLPDLAPGNQPLRFARLIVTRKDYPY